MRNLLGSERLIQPNRTALDFSPVNPLKDEEIVDTNSAGAFAGEFLVVFIIGKVLNEFVEAGHKLGRLCAGQYVRH